MAIRISGVEKRFGDHVVLNGVDFELPKGERMALIGPSPSGKTVLLKIILGLYEAEAGSVEVKDVDMATASRAERFRLMDDVGVLFQQNALFDSLTNWENVAFRKTHQDGMPRKEARDYATDLITAVGLGAEAADLYPADLSGGMQKRVGLARAIAADPDVLILDNPTAGLDPVLVTGIENLIFRLQEERGMTVLVVTAEIDHLVDRYDRIAVLADGAVQWSGPSDQAYPDANPYVVQMLNGERHGPIKMRLTEAESA